MTGCIDGMLAGTAEFLKSFKGFVTQAVSASPEASVAWAAVCLVLPLLTNHADAEEANREGFTHTTHRMEYYSALEPLVLGRDEHLTPALRVAIENRFETIYSALLEFQIRTALRFHERTAKTLIKETFNPNFWKELLANIEKEGALLHQDLQQVTSSALLLEAKRRNDLNNKHAEELRNLLRPLVDSMTEISDTNRKQWQTEKDILNAVNEQSIFQKLQAQRKDQQKMSEDEIKCLQRLRLTDTDTYEVTKDRVDAHVEGTCQWVVRQESFCQWMEQASGPLLITADPGCGKSVLTKYLMDHYLPRNSATICYFFFKEPHQTRVPQALCAILHQLFTQHPTLLKKYAVERLLKDHQGLLKTPSSLWSIFWEAVCDPEAGPVIVVMDALDECDPCDLKDFLVPYLRQSMAKSVDTRFLFTSRPYNSITSQFDRLHDVVPSYVRILGEDQCEDISREVNLVIEHRVEKFAKEQKLHAELKKKLHDMLLEIEHRTYLWVALLFDDLQYQVLKKTADGIESAIKRLPASVNDAYEKLLSRSTEHSTVRSALSFIIAATRPLTVLEMKIALNARAGILPKDDHESEQDFRERLRQLCGLFISFYKDTVYFFHQTAREFLLPHHLEENSVRVFHDNADTPWRSSLSVPQANGELAWACVQYLLLLIRDGAFDIGGQNHQVDGCSFYGYSCSHWVKHYGLSNGNLDMDMEFATAALSLCDPQTPGFRQYSSSIEQWRLEKLHPFLTPLRVASMIGCDAVVKYLFAKGIDLEVEKHGVGGEWPAVQLAAGRGYYNTASLLLSYLPPDAAQRIGAQPIFEWSDKYPFCPSIRYGRGADNGYGRLLQSILDHGFLNQPWKEGWLGRSLMEMNALSGRIEYVKMVLKTYERLDIEHQLLDLPYAAFTAISAKSEMILRLILDYGDGIVAADQTRSNNAPATVNCPGSQFIVRYPFSGLTLLDHAARRGSPPQIVRLLLDRGACIEASCDSGCTVLHYVAEGGDRNIKIARLLLDSGANPKVIDKYGRTALHEAAESPNGLKMMQLFINRGANINAVDADGITALHRAILTYGEASTVQLLIENGAQVEATDKYGNNSLHMAARHRRYDLMQLLIDGGANIDAVSDRNYGTPLHYVSAAGDVEGVRLLVSYGANIHARNIQGKTPLHLAISLGLSEEAAFLLMESGADLKVVVEDFGTTVAGMVTMWLKKVGHNTFSSRQLDASQIKTIRWFLQQALLVHKSATEFRSLLGQFVRDHELKLIDLVHHYDCVMRASEYPVSNKMDDAQDRERYDSARTKLLVEYQLLLQFFTEHDVNLEALEEQAWKECGVAVPSFWLYGEDFRFYRDPYAVY